MQVISMTTVKTNLGLQFLWANIHIIKVTTLTSIDPLDGNTAYKTKSNALQKKKKKFWSVQKMVKNPQQW